MCEHGFVDFVVSVSSVPDKVDDDVGVEGLSEFCGYSGDVRHCVWVVRVHMEDGRIDHSANVGAVRGRAGVTRISSEPDLVVTDQMNGTTDGIKWQMTKNGSK